MFTRVVASMCVAFPAQLGNRMCACNGGCCSDAVDFSFVCTPLEKSPGRCTVRLYMPKAGYTGAGILWDTI